MKKKNVMFKDMSIGDVGECWGDTLTGLYDRPTWIKCQKRTDYSVTVIAENDVETKSVNNCIGVNILAGKFDEFQIEQF